MQVPDDTSVNVVDDTVHTPVVDEVIVGVKPDDADVVKEIVDAEYVWFPGEVKLTVWAAFATVTAYVVVAELNLPVSVGVNVAVIVADPAPATVTAPVEEFTVATDVFDEAYPTEPATDADSKDAVGAVGVNDESP